MSITALLRRVTQEDLASVLEHPEIFQALFESEDPHADAAVAGTVDLEGVWHGVHFLFTDRSDGGAPPLDFLMAGGKPIGETDENRALLPAEVGTIARALASLTREGLAARYDTKRMAELDIYPNVWQRPGERELDHRKTRSGREIPEMRESLATEVVEIDVLVCRNDIEPRATLNAGLVFPGEKTGAQRTVGHDGNIGARAELAQGGVDATHRHIMDVLHTAKTREAEFRLACEHALELSRREVARAQRADPFAAHQDIERA